MAEHAGEAQSWSDFWSSELTRAFAADEAQEQALESFWTTACGNWNAGDRVLDIGCGNGALALTLAAIAGNAGKTFSYIGLDQAEIHPPADADFRPLDIVLHGGDPGRKPPVCTSPGSNGSSANTDSSTATAGRWVRIWPRG